VPFEAACRAGAVAAFTAACLAGASSSAAAAFSRRSLERAAGLSGPVAASLAQSLGLGGGVGSGAAALPAFVAAEAFAGPREGYAFKAGESGLGYYLESGGGRAAKKEKTAEEARMDLLLSKLSTEEARDGVRRLLKLTPKEVALLSPEQKDQVMQIRDMYAEHSEFSKSAVAAEKHRAKMAAQATALGSTGDSSGDGGGGPPAPPLPPGTKKGPDGKPVPMSAEEKVAKRRADELKWLEDFSAAEAKRREALRAGPHPGAAPALSQRDHAAASARAAAAAEAAAAREGAARRAAAAAQLGAMVAADGGADRLGATTKGAASLDRAGKVAGRASGALADKKRAGKVSAAKKREKHEAREEIRRLALSASSLSFA